MYSNSAAVTEGISSWFRVWSNRVVIKYLCLFNTHSGLKHVSDDQKTHKNPQLRSQAVPVQSGPKPFSAPRPTATASPARTLPPVLELEGKKWKVVSGKSCHEVCGDIHVPFPLFSTFFLLFNLINRRTKKVLRALWSVTQSSNRWSMPSSATTALCR